MNTLDPDVAYQLQQANKKLNQVNAKLRELDAEVMEEEKTLFDS